MSLKKIHTTRWNSKTGLYESWCIYIEDDEYDRQMEIQRMVAFRRATDPIYCKIDHISWFERLKRNSICTILEEICTTAEARERKATRNAKRAPLIFYTSTGRRVVLDMED